jgi:hypothetical protein
MTFHQVAPNLTAGRHSPARQTVPVRLRYVTSSRTSQVLIRLRQQVEIQQRSATSTTCIPVPVDYSGVPFQVAPMAASQAWNDISFDDFIMIPMDQDANRLQPNVTPIENGPLISTDSHSTWPDGSPVNIAWPTPESMPLLNPSPDVRTSTDELGLVSAARGRLTQSATTPKYDEPDDDYAVRGRHAPSRSQRGAYYCPHVGCHRVYERACDLRKHRKQAHLPRSKWSFECKACSTEFFSKRDWLRHIDTRKHKTACSESFRDTEHRLCAQPKDQPGEPHPLHSVPGLLTPPWQPPSPHSNLGFWQACWKPPEKIRPLNKMQATKPDFSVSKSIHQWYSADPARFISFDTPPNEATLLETPFHFTPSPGDGSAPHRGARV